MFVFVLYCSTLDNSLEKEIGQSTLSHALPWQHRCVGAIAALLASPWFWRMVSSDSLSFHLSLDSIVAEISRNMPAVVINTIGPFTGTALPLARACASGTHYIDLSNELSSVTALLGLHVEAEPPVVLVAHRSLWPLPAWCRPHRCFARLCRYTDVLQIAAIRNIANRRIAAIPTKAKPRTREFSWGHARVRWPSGETREGWLRAGDGMPFTVATVVEVAAHLAKGQGRAGAFTPGALFGPELAVCAGASLS